jgi:hypothetical protein
MDIMEFEVFGRLVGLGKQLPFLVIFWLTMTVDKPNRIMSFTRGGGFQRTYRVSDVVITSIVVLLSC